MTASPSPAAARLEPLLWIQVLGLAALPLQALLLVLCLGGADPGPFPGLERILTWALGALAPAVLFWRLPPDLWSLLLVQVPLRARTPLQLQLSALQTRSQRRLVGALGAVGLLPLLWWCDGAAGTAWAWSPLQGSPRLVVLLASAAVLLLMLWQWQQGSQAIGMLTLSSEELAASEPLSTSTAAEQRLTLGLPLLLLQPLQAPPGLPGVGSIERDSGPRTSAADVAAPPAQPSVEPEGQPAGPGNTTTPATDDEPPTAESPDGESPDGATSASGSQPIARAEETGAGEPPHPEADASSAAFTDTAHGATDADPTATMGAGAMNTLGRNGEDEDGDGEGKGKGKGEGEASDGVSLSVDSIDAAAALVTAVAVEPEESSEEDEGHQLDQQI